MPPLPSWQGATLIRCLLLLDLLANNGYRRTSTTGRKINGRPECPAPQFNAGAVLFADQTAGNPLEAVHQCRNGHGRRIIHQQMHMVILPVELHHLRAEILADGGEDAAQVGQHLAGKHTAAVFGHKDQVNMQVKNAMPAMSYLVCIGHRPSLQ